MCQAKKWLLDPGYTRYPWKCGKETQAQNRRMGIRKEINFSFSHRQLAALDCHRIDPKASSDSFRQA